MRDGTGQLDGGGKCLGFGQASLLHAHHPIGTRHGPIQRHKQTQCACRTSRPELNQGRLNGRIELHRNFVEFHHAKNLVRLRVEYRDVAFNVKAGALRQPHMLALGQITRVQRATVHHQFPCQCIIKFIIHRKTLPDQRLIGRPHHRAVRLIGVGPHRFAHAGDVGHGGKETFFVVRVFRIGEVLPRLIGDQQVLNEVHADLAFALQHALGQYVRHQPTQAQRNHCDHGEATQCKSTTKVQR